MKKRTILLLTILAVGLLMWKWLACGYNPDKPTEFYPIGVLSDSHKTERWHETRSLCSKQCTLRHLRIAQDCGEIRH